MLRFVSFDKDDDYDDDDDNADDSDVPFLPHLAPIESSSPSSVSLPFETYGLTVIDHDLATAAEYIEAFTGYHEFAENSIQRMSGP